MLFCHKTSPTNFKLPLPFPTGFIPPQRPKVLGSSRGQRKFFVASNPSPFEHCGGPLLTKRDPVPQRFSALGVRCPNAVFSPIQRRLHPVSIFPPGVLLICSWKPIRFYSPCCAAPPSFPVPCVFFPPRSFSISALRHWKPFLRIFFFSPPKLLFFVHL